MLNLNTNKFAVSSRSRSNRGAQPSLRLTSLVDMLTILLVFLLKSYSADGQIISLSEDLQLPTSTASKTPVSAPVIKITNEFIMLDDLNVATVKEIFDNSKLEIVGLRRALATQKQISTDLGKIDASLAFKGDITIQGDKKIPFRILKKIMYTCGQEGYNNIYLAVIKQG